MLMTEKQYNFIISREIDGKILGLGLKLETITKQQASDIISNYIQERKYNKDPFEYVNEWAITNGYL